MKADGKRLTVVTARRIYPEDRTQDANHWRRPQSHHVGRGRGVRLPEIEGVLDLLSKIFKTT